MITFSSPIGNPTLTHLYFHSFIHNNLTSVKLNPQFITDDIGMELCARCISSPFTINETHNLFQGHFHTSLLGLVSKPGKDPSALHMIHHLSIKDSCGCSTNDWLDSYNFPTKWSTATHCADFVSSLPCLRLPTQEGVSPTRLSIFPGLSAFPYLGCLPFLI